MSWWLVGTEGVRRRVGPRGLVLGRSEHCDIVLDDPKASAVHALVLTTARGAELRSIGRNPTQVDGQPVSGAILQDGATIEVPGASFQLVRAAEAQVGWVLQWGRQRFAVRGGPLLVGSAPTVDLLLPGWPPEAFLLTQVEDALVMEALAPVRLGNREQEPGAVETLEEGDHIAWQGEDLRVRAASGGAPPTVQRDALPVAVHFSFLPTGARLSLTFARGRQVEVDLPELRARLVATLLQPPGAYQAGEFVPDELVLGRVWPGRAERGRTDLNTLVHRARKDLLRAGLSPTPMLARAPTGGGTAFRLAAGASVVVG